MQLTLILSLNLLTPIHPTSVRMRLRKFTKRNEYQEPTDWLSLHTGPLPASAAPLDYLVGVTKSKTSYSYYQWPER